jgi:ribosomal protein S18 acetylase RimI-like enzyme
LRNTGGNSGDKEIDRVRTVLNDFSAPSLVRAIKANWADYYTYLGRSPTAELSVGPYVTWCLTGIPDSFLNVVFRTRLPPDRAGEIINETLAHFKSRRVKRCSWWAETDIPRTDLDPHLIAHGLTFDEGGTGMAADLMTLPEGLPRPAGLTIIPVEDQATLRQWSQVTRIGFGIPEHAESGLYDLFADLALELPMRSYLALLNGQPVGTSQLFLSAGVAGIYNVACLPEARQQGVGAAVTLAALREARQQGYRISILQASDQGYGVYRRLGFHAYGKLNIYLWENEAEPVNREGNGA